MVEKVKLPKGVSKEEAEKFLSSLKQEPIIFKEIEVGPNSIIRIQQSYYKNRKLLGLQKFWRQDPTQEWQFGKAITFPDESIDDVIEGFTAMKTYLDKELEE
jgi:hypothetical protein